MYEEITVKYDMKSLGKKYLRNYFICEMFIRLNNIYSLLDTYKLTKYKGLTEIGKRFGINRSRVKQIIDKASRCEMSRYNRSRYILDIHEIKDLSKEIEFKDGLDD